MFSSDTAKAITLKICATVAFTVIALIIRHFGELFAVGQIAFARGVGGIVPILIFYGLRGQLDGAWRTDRFSQHIVRGSIAAIGTFTFIGAFTRLPVVDVTAISFLAPLITVVMAAVFLKEQVHVYRWSAVIVGFGGVLLMLVPYLGIFDHPVTAGTALGLVLALSNAFCAAGASIQVRRLSATETTVSILIYYCLFVSVAGFLTLPFGWHMPQSIPEWLALFGIGIMSGVAQILHTTSYRYGAPSLLAPFDYATMLWAFIFGYALFGEVPSAFVVIGAVIVVAAGLFVIWRERQLGLVRVHEPPFAPASAEADLAEAAQGEAEKTKAVRMP
jgi:drug/metabolite transporter (DMT)-like permease